MSTLFCRNKAGRLLRANWLKSG